MKFVAFPFRMTLASVWMLRPDYIGLRNALEEAGYTVTGVEVESKPDTLASKGTIEVFTNPERRTLGVRGLSSTVDLVESYNELMKINLKRLAIEPENILFHEFLGDFSVSTGSSPIEVLTKINEKIDVVPLIGNVLDMDVYALGLNIVSRKGSPTSPKWANFNIRPYFPSFNKRYLVSVVFRDELDLVTDFVKHIENKLENMFLKIEKD